MQAWILYQMRFVLTAEMIGALSTFGGLPGSLAHLSVVLTMETTDSVAVAMVYGRLVKQHLEENARARSETTIRAGTPIPSWSLKMPLFGSNHPLSSPPRPHPPKAAQNAAKNPR